jgi:hypothetical protein
VVGVNFFTNTFKRVVEFHNPFLLLYTQLSQVEKLSWANIPANRAINDPATIWKGAALAGIE